MERMKLEFDKCKLESEVTEDSLQDKLETICMTANTVVNQSVFHFFKVIRHFKHAYLSIDKYLCQNWRTLVITV